MARDRLAALRAQQRAGISSPTSPGGAYEQSTPSPQQNDGYELTNINGGSDVPPSNIDDMSTFYSEISSIQDSLRTFNDNVSRISDLHSRSLGPVDDSSTQRNAQQLDGLVATTSSLSNELKVRIQNLQKKDSSGRDGQIRKQQTSLVKQKFVEAIQNYQQVEQQYRLKYRQRMERQLKIVKPDATPEEVKAVIENDQGQQIFTQALQSSDRYGESRAAYREVQGRHEDIQKIERTLGELAQLFNDMSILVEQQDETINTIEAAAANVQKDTEVGLQHTDKAVASARAARRKRWICFFIILIIIAIIAIVLGIHFGIQAANNKKAKQNTG